jgi:hypothetical protein
VRGGGEGGCGPIGPRKAPQNSCCIRTAPLGTVVTTLLQLTDSQQQPAGCWLIVNLAIGVARVQTRTNFPQLNRNHARLATIGFWATAVNLTLVGRRVACFLKKIGRPRDYFWGPLLF